LTTSHSFETSIGGRNLVIETGKLASQASGAVTVRYGDTVILAAATIGREREGVDFLPLTIDYEERHYAAGKIPGGFLRREGRPTETATLTARLTDRPIRPLLPKNWRRDVQIIITTFSVDHENDPDILATIGSSAALTISEMPFDGPISAVHVGYIDSELVINPTIPQLEKSQLDLVVTSTSEGVIMLEAGASEVPEDVVARAVKFGHEANQAIIKIQEELRKAVGKPKLEVPSTEADPGLVSAVSAASSGKLSAALGHTDKAQRAEAMSSLKEELVSRLAESHSESEILAVFDGLVKKEFRNILLEKGLRPTGRRLDEIRPITTEAALLPRVHGSALFSRGETQVLTITTLGPMNRKQPIDGLGLVDSKRFIHHYNFPPYSVGEAKRAGSTSRREIGHGALAERALLPVLPKNEDFPYTIRLVSEVLSSNGSTSMASTCASSMSLMDAGIPVSRAVAGISIGLVTGEQGKFVTLTDIEGMEDNYGDMDFKVAGTDKGITAIQLDMKVKGISLEIVNKTLEQALEARLFILGEMGKTIGASRAEMSPYAPRMHKITIDPDKIGALIGPGGKTIRAIQEGTATTIDVDNEGIVFVGATSQESADKAIKMIQALVKDVAIGDIYTGKVVRIMGFGAFVELVPGKDGMVHISELANNRVDKVEDVVKLGDEVKVKVIDIDSQGRVNLSIRALLEGATEQPGPSPDYPFRSDRGPQPPRSRPPDGGGRRPFNR
jgi:polyribonucleotide nucleotidyltransferase